MKIALAFCGGGQRGVFPACTLVELERQTGKLTREVVDFVSGTSTGALIAAAVAAGIPATTILDVYVNRTKEIFKPAPGILADAEMAVRGHKYSSTNIHRVLLDVFGPQAGWAMKDCPIGIMICATAANGHDWFFVRHGKTASVSLLDAITASAAAPTYFDPWRVTIEGKPMWFFDGGAGGVANPTYQTAVELFWYSGFPAYKPEDTRIITLGTGYCPVASDLDIAPPAGILQAIEWATGTLVDTGEDWVDAAVARQWPGVATKLDVALPSDIAMDDLSAIPQMLKLGQVWAAKIDWKQVLGI